MMRDITAQHSRPSSRTRGENLELMAFASWRPYALLTLLIVVFFGHTLNFQGFTHQDDYYLIVESYPIIRDPAHVLRAFVEDVYHRHQGGNLYRPTLTLSLMLDAAWSGSDLFGYRLTNLLLHVLATILAFAFLRSLTFSPVAAFAGALLFGLHPTAAQTVAWIPGRNDSLLAVFLFTSLLSFDRFLKTMGVRWLALHVVALAAALFTKETALAIPIVSALLYWSSWRTSTSWAARVVTVASWLAIFFIWLACRNAAMLAPLGTLFHFANTLLHASWITLTYVGSAVWPGALFVVAVQEDARVLEGALGLLALFVIAFQSKRTDWRLWTIGLLWFLVFLVPTLYQQPNVLVPPRYFQHRIYVPLLGLILMVLSTHIVRLQPRRYFVPLLLAGVALVFAAFTVRHSFAFENALAFNEAIATTSPRNPFILNDAGAMLDETLLPGSTLRKDKFNVLPAVYRGALEAKREMLVELLQRDPANASLLRALGIVSFGLGRMASARVYLEKSLTLEPRSARGHYNIGLLYFQGHEEELAKRHWYDVLTLDPTLAETHRNLSYLHYRSKRYLEALTHAEAALGGGLSIPPEFHAELRAHVSSK